MLSTNLHVLLFSFNETTETIIVNTTNKSLNDIAKYIKENKYTIEKVKVFSRHTGRFGKANKNHVKAWTDHSIDLNLILDNQGF